MVGFNSCARTDPVIAAFRGENCSSMTNSMFAAWAVGIDTSSLDGQQPPPMEYWEAVDDPSPALLLDALLGRRCESTSYYHVMYVEFENFAPVMTVHGV